MASWRLVCQPFRTQKWPFRHQWRSISQCFRCPCQGCSGCRCHGALRTNCPPSRGRVCRNSHQLRTRQRASERQRDGGWAVLEDLFLFKIVLWKICYFLGSWSHQPLKVSSPSRSEEGRCVLMWRVSLFNNVFRWPKCSRYHASAHRASGASPFYYVTSIGARQIKTAANFTVGRGLNYF